MNTTRKLPITRLATALGRTVRHLLLATGVVTLCVALTFSSVVSAYQIDGNQNPNGRAKIDSGWRGVTVSFNRGESKRIANYAPVAAVPVAAINLIFAAVATLGVAYVQEQVYNKGKCIRYSRPWMPVTSKGSISLYSGGYCK